jgi:GR25 family glycosyltransferase involved in LPS biosynthesis
MPNEYSLIWPSEDGSMYVPNGDRNPDMDIKMNIPIFVIHYTPLTDRKQHMLTQLSDHGLQAEFITQFDRENITDFTFFDTSKISSRCISNLMKHCEIYRKMIQDNIPYAIVFDDDVCLAKDFNKIMNETLKNLPSTFDICYMGDICGFHIKDINLDTNVYLKSNQDGHVFTTSGKYEYSMGSSRGPAYILTNACAHKIMSMFVPGYKISRLGHDHWMTDVAREKNLQVYWSEPTFVCGGSDIETFKSSLGHQEWANTKKQVKKLNFRDLINSPTIALRF